MEQAIPIAPGEPVSYRSVSIQAAPDGEKMRIGLLLLMPPKEFKLDLRLLSGMARLLTQDAVRRGLLAAEDTSGEGGPMGSLPAGRTRATCLFAYGIQRWLHLARARASGLDQAVDLSLPGRIP